MPKLRVTCGECAWWKPKTGKCGRDIAVENTEVRVTEADTPGCGFGEFTVWVPVAEEMELCEAEGRGR